MTVSVQSGVDDTVGLAGRIRRMASLPRHVAADRNAPFSRMKKLSHGAAGMIGLVVLWQIFAANHIVNPLVTSSPSAIVHRASQLYAAGTLGTVCLQSLELFAVAFGLSLVIGIGVGIIIGWYRTVGAVLDPLVSFMYAAPRVALIPLITVWFGVGFRAQVVTVLLISVFPIIINVQAGVNSVDRNLMRVARGYMASSRDVLWTVALPGAVPHVVSGIRNGLSQGLVGVVVAEYLIGNAGIGGLIVSAGQSLDSAAAFVGLIIIASMALVFTTALRRLERHMDHWRH